MSHWQNLGLPEDAQFREERIPFGAGSRQYMLHIAPEKPLHGKSILFYHGGGWQFGSPEQFRKYAYVLAQEGYEVFLPSHRKIPFYNYSVIRTDIQSALRTVAARLRDRGGVGEKIVLGGMSSGGNLAALLALDPENREAAELDENQIAGLFVLAAPLDLEQMWNSPPLLAFAGPRSGALFQQANPANFLHAGPIPPPTLIIHGESDAMVEAASARSFYEKFERVHPGRARFILLPNGSHLDVASWAYRENFIRDTILGWLKEV
ncbi:MAG: alpha/beta hydrolase [Saprospirales bacterium]|nr:alpha/beta hydrolase [Saprospirales bacterium]